MTKPAPRRLALYERVLADSPVLTNMVRARVNAITHPKDEAVNDDMTASPAREHANTKVAQRIAGVGHLTPAELRVVKYVAIGLERREIALATGLSVRTVDAQRIFALRKLGLRNNVDLAKWAIMAGYVTL